MEIQSRYREILNVSSADPNHTELTDLLSREKSRCLSYLGTQSTCSLTQPAQDYATRTCDSLGSLSNAGQCEAEWRGDDVTCSQCDDVRVSKSRCSSVGPAESFVWFGGDDTETSHIDFGSEINLTANDLNMSKINPNCSTHGSKRAIRSPKVRMSSRPKFHCGKSMVLMSKKKNNENNNFMKDWRGKFTEPGRASSWRDENVFNRIETLSMPKKDFSELNDFENKGDCEKKQWDECRIAKLAQPKPLGGEWCGRGDKENRWECTYPFEKKYCRENMIDPCTVDWDRHAHCRVPYQPPDRTDFSVSRAALNAVATRRLEKLSVPRKIVDSDEYYLWLLNKKPDTDAKLKPIKRLSIHKIELKGERVFLRCDLDHTKTPPPLEQKVDQIRLTTQYALNRGAKAVIVASHCGKPRGRSEGNQYSLKKACDMLAQALNKEVVFLDDCIGPEAQALCEDPEPGSVFVLENLRYYPEEEGYSLDDRSHKIPCTKEQIQTFRHKLFALGDVFIHDDFSSLVDMSNTTIGSQKQERGYGWNIFFELSKYNTFVTRPVQPMVAVIGGNFNDKIDMVHNIMGKAQEVLLGGEIAHIFLKTLKGIDIGTTPSCPNKEKKVLNAMARAKDIKCVVSMPSDLVVRNTKKPNEYFTVSTKLDVEPWFEIVDIGAVTRDCYINAIKNAKSVVWSGDMGVLLDGTSEIGQVIHDVTVENQTNTFIMDEETETTFKNLVKNGRVTAVTGDGRVTSLLLKNKIPKGLQALSPYRKNIKKRHPKVEPVSVKPVELVRPGYRIETGFNKLCVDQVDVEDKIVMIECDLTAPVIQGRVIDHYSLRMVVPTIKWVLKRGARCVVLCSPLMSRDARVRHDTSLRPMAQEMERLLKRRVIFVPYPSGKKVQDTIEFAYDGSVVMLENILDDPEENFTFKGDPIPGFGGRRRSPENIAAYCEMLSKQCDIWVNDAFSLLNRDSSATTGCMHKVRPCGFLIKNELKYLSKTFNKPQRKFLAILGGHQCGKQIEIMKELMRDVDEMILTGLLGLHCLWVLQGMKLGLNFDRTIQKADIQALLDMAAQHKVRLYFPVDMLTTSDLESGRNTTTLSTSDGIGAGRYFADIGPKTISLFSRIIKRSKLVLWVGVVGLCTHEEFRKGTRSILDTIMECTLSTEINMVSIIGGEFLTKYVHALNRNHEGISHITTGPDVMLTLLSERNCLALNTLSYNAQARVKCIHRMNIDQIDIKDKRVLLRADFRAPGKSSASDDQEPMKHLSGVIKNLWKRGALCITLIGHMGDPKGHREETLSLLPIKTSLEKHLKKEIMFFDTGLNEVVENTLKMPENGKLYMMENMRFNHQETGRGINSNEQMVNSTYEEMDAYRNRLSTLGDVFVNESMDALHLTDASVAGIQIEQRVAGMTMKTELMAFGKLIPRMQKPVLAIVAGDDVYDKMMLLYDIIDICDQIIIAGKVALNFLRTTKGMSIGKEMPDKLAVKLVHRILSKAAVQEVKVQFPLDFAVLVPANPDDEEPEDSLDVFTVAQGIPESQRMVDIGEESMEAFTNMINEAKTVLFTGGIGQCNIELGSIGTRAVLEAMSTNTAENGAVTIAFGTHASMMCLSSLEEAAGLSFISRAKRTVVDLIMGCPLPGLEHLNLPQLKPLPYLTMEQVALKGKKVLLRLDLDLPTVDGVVLDNDKIEDALDTIRYILKQDPLCLIMCGFRGNPNGYKNNYLSMKPLILEFEYFLETTVLFLDEPCSRKTRILCEDPTPGTVFLMENLKFYPAEVGEEEEKPDILNAEPEPVVPSPQKSSKIQLSKGKSRSQFNLNQIGQEGGENIDKVMYELMPFKNVEQYTREIGDCCDVFINDDVTHIWLPLVSNLGFDADEKACGLRLKDHLQYADSLEEFKKAPGVEALTLATKEQMAM